MERGEAECGDNSGSMKDSAHNSGASEPSQYPVSAFTKELIDDVAREHYHLHAWQIFLSRSWARSLEDIGKSPARTRSFWRWAAVVAAAGASIILLALRFQTPGQALTALAWWLPWYAGAVFFVLIHLGMADNDQGVPYHSLLLPNGLSFLRLALAPLILWPCLTIPVHPIAGPVFALILAGLALSDLLDGWFARRRKLCTRLGRMLDVLADLALLTFLAIGLYLAGAIPGSLLCLLIVRYPLMSIGVTILYFARGPAPLTPTSIGRITTFAIHVVLLVLAFKLLLPTSLPPSIWIEWALWILYLLIGANILYLFYCGVAWAGLRKNHS
jgi:cardiolipin synthase